MTVAVRPETGDDVEAIRAVHLAAFPTSVEADLVTRLHGDFDSAISLVAEDGNLVLGHVMMSRMEVEGGGRGFRALGLAPVAVLPSRQREGIGGALIREALRRARGRGEELVFVLGEPAYYGRFGFSAQAAAPFASPYAGPCLMAQAFGVALPAAGRADYAPAFASLG